MFVLVTYDVSTTSPEGRKRLRQVAKTCLNYGQRVQNSVFELLLDYAQWTECKNRLCTLIDPTQDSLRFY
jgi:CRISPR-associated protein Cas2